MKKLFFIFVLFLFSKDVLIAQNSLPKVTVESFEGNFFQVVEQSGKRVMYAINMNQLETESLKSTLINRLYKSKKIVVISRIDANGILLVSAPANFSAKEIETEILALKDQPAPEITPTKY